MLLVLAAALRGVVFLAYQPALIIPAVLLHSLWLISLVQHLIGLATGVLVYAVLVRFGVGPGSQRRPRFRCCSIRWS